MVYAYDLNIQLPVRDLYDTQMMLASILTAKDMYEKGQLELKDFNKQYGDFMSPFSKDMLRYNEMVGGVRNIINQLYANGIDPLRSPEGRSAVSRAIQSINPAEYNNMRANAKVGYAYLDALGKLNSKGLYDPAMNDYYLRSQGLPSFEDFSSANGAVWSLSSPVEAITLRDLTSPGFAHRTAHDLTPEQARSVLGSAFDPRAKYTGWVYDDLYNTAGQLVPGLRGDWRGEYFRQLSAQKALQKNPNATDEDINKQFQSDIAEANRQWLIDPKGDLSDYYQRVNNSLKIQQMRLSQANADRDYILKLAKAGIKIDPASGKFIYPTNRDEYVLPVELRLIDKQVTSRLDALLNYQQLFMAAIQNNRKHIEKYENEKNASTLGYREEQTYSEPVIIPSMSGNTPYIFKGLTTKRTPYIKNKNSEEILEKLQKNAENAKINIGAYENILKSGPDALVKAGYLDNNGVPTEKYTKLMAQTYLNKNYLSSLSDDEKDRTIEGVFNSLYSAGTLAEGDFKNWRNNQFASGNLEELPGVKGKKLISTTTGGFRYAPLYKENSLGIRSKQVRRDLDTWLNNNIEAWVWDDGQIQDYFIPSKTGESYVTSGTIIVSKEDLLNFAKQYGYNFEKLIKSEKIKSHVYTKSRDKISPYETPILYCEIPVMNKIDNNGGFNYYRINETVNKKDFGTKQNTEDRTDAQRQSVMN